MVRLRSALVRLWTTLRRDHTDRELTRELHAHLHLLEDEYRRRGHSPEAAARAARLALGGVEQAREQHREARTLGWLDDLGHDLGHAVRGVRRAPRAAALVVATLAIGIGLTTAIFTVVQTLLLRPLPYAPDPARLVRLVSMTPATATTPARRQDVGVTADEARTLASHLHTLDGAGMVGATIMNVRGVDGAGAVTIGSLSPDTWRLLDARPALGRLVADGGDGEREIVLSHSAWRRYFGGDPAVLGRTLTLDAVLGRRVSRTLVVVGVMPETFTFPRPETVAWTAPPPTPVSGNAVYRGRLLARLAPGVSRDAALAELAPVVREVRGHGPEVRYALETEQDALVGPVRPAALVLLAAVVVLLLIACLNVTNLLLARALARSRELSVRAALGASRGRLARQALTDSALLGLLGGVGGLAVAAGAVAMFRRLATVLPRLDLSTSGPGWGGSSFPRLNEVAIDGSVVLFALVVATACGLAVGLGAAWRASRADVFGAFRATGVSRRGVGLGGARQWLVVMQVAAAMTLLVGAVVLTSSLQRLLGVDTGYVAARVTTFQVALPPGAYPDARLAAFAEALTTRVRGVPGVETAAYANQTPMVQLRDTAGGLWTTPDATRAFAPDAADARFVSQDYLRALGVRVVAGRGFTESDGANAPRVLLVNQALVRRQFADRAPVGRSVFVGRDVRPWTIVGVVADVRQFGLETAPEPQFFMDLRQWNGGMPLFPAGAYFVVTGALAPDALSAAVRPIVRDLEPEAALFNVTPMADIVASSVARPRLYATLVGTFALVGALLAAVGLYGVLSYLVQERTAEIGVRIALGAAPAAVVRMIARQGGRLVLGGLVLGTAGGLALSRAATSLLFGVRPTDPGTYVMAAAGFAIVAAIAILVPARRAARVDPIAAIRCE